MELLLGSGLYVTNDPFRWSGLQGRIQKDAAGQIDIRKWPVALSNQPVFDLQSADTHELAHIRRHQNCSEGRGVGGDE